MTVQSLSALLAAIITAALAVAMLIRDPRNKLHTSFSLLTGILFLNYLSSFIFVVSEEGLWFRVSILAALAIPASAIRFFTIFLGQTEGIGHKATQVSVTLSLLLAPFVFSDFINRYFVRLIVLAFVFSSLLLCMLMIFDRLRQTTSRVESARLKYLLFGGLVAILFSLSDYLPRVDVMWFPALGNSITVIYMYFLSQIIIQFRLLDLNELVGKMLVLAVLVTLLATVYSLVGFFVSDIPGLVFFNTFIAGFVILILFDPINRAVEDKVNRLLFRERYEFGRQLAMLRRELANVVDIEEMAQLILTRLENSRRVTGASVYILDEAGTILRRLGFIGPPSVEVIDAVTDRRVLDRIRDATALVVEDLPAERRDLINLDDEDLAGLDDAAEAARVLKAVEADVSVAMTSEDGRVMGLLNVADQRMSDAYSPEEIAHFVSIANQATICIENSRIVAHMRDRDRLAVVGEMAAGLAHEVRNPLGAIKGAAQMLHDDAQNADMPESAEFLDIIVDEVNRLNKVVSAFLDYAKPYGGVSEPTHVNFVIDKVSTLLGQTANELGVDFELELDQSLAPARIDPEVLRQVVWNLGLNALQALEEDSDSANGETTLGELAGLGGALDEGPEGTAEAEARSDPAKPRRLRIKTRQGTRGLPMRGGFIGRESIEIIVEDTGPGIESEDLDRIFIPFYTTKSKGTGLGLAICQRLVRAAGGDIIVSSRVGNGATFTVLLALWTDDMVSASAERKRIDVG